MKVIFDIARAELRSLFYSPVAWFVLIVFQVMNAIMILSLLKTYSVEQDVYIELLGNKFTGSKSKSLTIDILGNANYNLSQFFFVFIPLLTMAVINREYSSGTIKMLHTSPITPRQVVVGKFLGTYGFSLIMVLQLMLTATVVAFSIQDAEWYYLIALFLGYACMTAVYIAVGLFISSLTTYPIVAALGTFVVLLLLMLLGFVLQGYDYIRDVTFFLSLGGRVAETLQGLITTKNMIYFLTITLLFLSFTIIRTKSLTESKPKWVVAGRYMAAFSVGIICLLISSVQGWIGYWDVTRSKVNTIHDNTVNVLHQMDGSPLKVTLYANLFGENLKYGIPTKRNLYLWERWSKYLRFYNNMEFEYVYYYDISEGDSSIFKNFPGKSLEEIAAKSAELSNVSLSLFKTPAEIKNIIHLGEEKSRLVMMLEYQGKKTFMRTYRDATNWFPDEINVSGSILRLINDTTPTFKFMTGHYERSPFYRGEREYGNHANNILEKKALVNQGLNFDTISTGDFSSFLKEDVLVVADPKTHLEQAIIDSVKQYIDRGGNAIFYSEPNKQSVMNPILNHVGVHAESGTIVRENVEDLVFKLTGISSKAGAVMSDAPNLFKYRAGMGPLPMVAIRGASSLSFKEVNDFQVEPIIYINNDTKTWIENSAFVLDSIKPDFNREEGDIASNEPYMVGLKLFRKIGSKEQRIVIVSDADMMANLGGGNGGDFDNTFYSYVVDNKYPIYHNSKPPLDTWLRINKGTAQMFVIVFTRFIPIFLLIAGIIILVRRKRK